MKEKVGTGIFNFKDKCQDCGSESLVDINGFCQDCYIEWEGLKFTREEKDLMIEALSYYLYWKSYAGLTGKKSKIMKTVIEKIKVGGLK